MDKIKGSLNVKQEEKKLSLKDDFGSETLEDETNNMMGEEIIDEEELMLLRTMKDLKKSYRENFD